MLFVMNYNRRNYMLNNLKKSGCAEKAAILFSV